jgi:FkbM family methyltransferase
MNNNLLIVILLLIFTIIITIIFTIDTQYFDTNYLSELIYYNEDNTKIDNIANEYTEQEMAIKYIKPDDVVLELGARYGSVTCVISKILNNPNNLVAVEPDSNVWNALENNLEKNNCKANIHKGFISNKKLSLSNSGYGSTSTVDDNSTIPTLTLQEVKDKYKINDFNTLIVDCEGCFESFLDENPTILNTINKIMIEHDQPHKCNYQKITQLLINNNFKLIERSETAVVHEVWKK